MYVDSHCHLDYHERDGDLDEQFCTVTDVELEIKYLKGKNFHRSYVAADLGPYDHRT